MGVQQSPRFILSARQSEAKGFEAFRVGYLDGCSALPGDIGKFIIATWKASQYLFEQLVGLSVPLR